MFNKRIFLQFLYLLSKKEINDHLYLEGGAALSFIYGLDRVFSGDLDFTIDDYGLRLKLLNTIEEIMVEINKNKKYTYISTSNKVIIRDNNKIILQIDFYPLATKLFTWEEKNLFYGDKFFLIKTHSLEDIFAEKITNILQSDRFEFKDIVDTNSIHKILMHKINVSNFKIYLGQKLVGKQIIQVTKNDPSSIFLNKRADFANSHQLYNKKIKVEFKSEFISCYRIIEKYL